MANELYDVSSNSLDPFTPDTDINAMALRYTVPLPRMTRALQCMCEAPGCRMPGDRRRQNTAYHEDELNFNTLCFVHQAETDAYWDERWRDYYSGVLW